MDTIEIKVREDLWMEDKVKEVFEEAGYVFIAAVTQAGWTAMEFRLWEEVK